LGDAWFGLPNPREPAAGTVYGNPRHPETGVRLLSLVTNHSPRTWWPGVFEASYESSAAEAFGNLPSSAAYLSPAFRKAEPSSMNFRC